MEQVMSDQALREHVVYLLKGGGAHLNFEQAIADLPEGLRGAMVKGVSHTPWRLLEHLRICQWDILEFSHNPEHVSPDFPNGYWPEDDAPPDSVSWDKSIQAFRADLQAMIDRVSAADGRRARAVSATGAHPSFSAAETMDAAIRGIADGPVRKLDTQAGENLL